MKISSGNPPIPRILMALVTANSVCAVGWMVILCGMTIDRTRVVGALAVALVSTTRVAAATNDPVAWPPIIAQARPWTWWWWHGSAVDETNLAHELKRFDDAGLGGVQITAIYGTKGAEAREIPYLSPRWLAMMGYTVDEAARLGMGVDMSLGSGWCFGGPTVGDRDANASVVVETFEVLGGQTIAKKLSLRDTQALVAYSTGSKPIDLTGKIRSTGEVDWVAPAGNWTVYAISQRPSGQRVKRAAAGGAGWMLNPAYPQAMRDWLAWFDRAFAGYTGSKPAAVFQDSYEYRTDWSPDFFAQFQKLRGYPLQKELPALFGDLRDEPVARLKYDYRRTLSDVMAEQSEPEWIRWAHRRGLAAIYQAHGTPANWLDLYGDADVPETEMFHNDRSILISKFASSAAHTQGHPLTGAETGTWLKEHFTETLADLKYLADDMFLAGVNHIYYHGACYSPEDAPWPGWLFYASTEMNPRNPIWHDVGALNEYIARCQSILQTGAPDDEVLLYWPVADFWSDPRGLVQPMTVSQTEWFEGQPIGKIAHELWNHGYAFDYVSDAQLLRAKVVDGQIRMPGATYKTILAPPCNYMPWETIQELFALAKDGATVCLAGGPPRKIAGRYNANWERKYKMLLKKYALDDAALLIGGHSHPVGKGRFLCGDPLAALDLAKVAREPVADSGLSFVRRASGHDWNYFIANRTGTDFDGWITFGRPAKSVIMLDPMTGDWGSASLRQTGGLDLPRVRLQLLAGGSLILRASADGQFRGKPWPYWKPSPPPAGTQTLTGDWRVKFIAGGPTLPPDFQTNRLGSWTTWPEAGVQSFAGTAEYDITFDTVAGQGSRLPSAFAGEEKAAFESPNGVGVRFALDLGDVCQSARVSVNGKDYGTLITPPFRVIVDNLKPKDNVLDVEVTSVAANRIRDLDRRGVNWKIFKDINLVDINYAPFNAANWPLRDCGLLGPVTLTPVEGE
ncbi:MAG TPA: glycosyl hydrolase [Candidatus Acidoferrales bacterium]|nr:glycosyl hydrolase [Candidatus Acidoferrales bacterium]